MTSIYNIGCFVGAMSTIITGDMLGRPRQILLGSTVIAVGAVRYDGQKPSVVSDMADPFTILD